MATIKKLREEAEALGMSLSECVSEIDRGGKPDKPYKLTLVFDRMDQMIAFVRNNFSADDVGVYRAMVLDPEYREFGRAPKNSYVMRATRNLEFRDDERVDK